MRVENGRDLAGKVSTAGRLCPVTRHDGAGRQKSPEPRWAVGTGQGKGCARGWRPWHGTCSVLHVPI